MPSCVAIGDNGCQRRRAMPPCPPRLLVRGQEVVDGDDAVVENRASSDGAACLKRDEPHRGASSAGLSRLTRGTSSDIVHPDRKLLRSDIAALEPSAMNCPAVVGKGIVRTSI